MEGPRERFDATTVDMAVVLAVAGVALTGLVLPPLVGVASWERVGAAAVTLALLQGAALWWRRRRPAAVLAATLACVLLAEALGDANAAVFLGPHVAAYTAGALAPQRDRFVLAAAAVAALGELGLRWVADGEPYTVLLGPAGIMVAVAWGAGRYVRVRRAYVSTLVAYAERLESERDEQAQRAVLEERRRIARELHDQVAHHLGVVALQTGAARRWLQRDPERAAGAMAAAEESVRTALTTMPVILQALRSDGHGELAPQSDLADLDALVRHVNEAGVPVELAISGERRRLNPAVECTAFRVVQEALTNTMKHAGPARATVTLRFGSERLDIEVRDDGHGPAAPPPPSSGFGLSGMRERVDLLGGELDAGAAEGGGFVVRASLPLRGEERVR